MSVLQIQEAKAVYYAPYQTRQSFGIQNSSFFLSSVMVEMSDLDVHVGVVASSAFAQLRLVGQLHTSLEKANLALLKYAVVVYLLFRILIWHFLAPRGSQRGSYKRFSK